MEKRENNTLNITNGYISVMITQGICILLLIAGTVCIKYFFKETYANLKEFYNNEICSVTDTNEVMSSRGGKL